MSVENLAVISVPAKITGLMGVGNVLTASTPTVSNGTLRTIQWQRQGVDLPGETNDTYTQVSADLNRIISVTAFAESVPEAANEENYPAVVTPDTPVITDQDDNTNTITFTAVGDTEANLKGAGWNDATSPLDVGNVSYAIGEIEIRVKSDGVNPPSLSALNTIPFTQSNLIVQYDDGLVENANAYISEEYLEDYWSKRNVDLSSQSQGVKEAAIIESTSYIDQRYTYKGYKLNGYSQTTEFPRGNLYVCVGSTSELVEGIPKEVKAACAEYAYRVIQGTELQPDGNAEGSIKKKKEQVGPLSEEIEFCGCGSSGGFVAYPTADNLLKIFTNQSANGYFTRA
jgi:hypothetical protein